MAETVYQDSGGALTVKPCFLERAQYPVLERAPCHALPIIPPGIGNDVAAGEVVVDDHMAGQYHKQTYSHYMRITSLQLT